LDPFKATEVKKKMLLNYLREIRTPLYKYKEKDMLSLEKRADQTNMLVLKDLQDKEIDEIMTEIFKPNDED